MGVLSGQFLAWKAGLRGMGYQHFLVLEGRARNVGVSGWEGWDGSVELPVLDP